jgi:hypothetical protein
MLKIGSRVVVVSEGLLTGVIGRITAMEKALDGTAWYFLDFEAKQLKGAEVCYRKDCLRELPGLRKQSAANRRLAARWSKSGAQEIKK